MSSKILVEYELEYFYCTLPLFVGKVHLKQPFFSRRDNKSKLYPQDVQETSKNTVAQCTDTPNFIFAINQGGLGKTLEVYM